MNKLTIILTTALLLAGATTWAQRQQIGTSTTFWELSVSGGDTTLIISGTGDIPDFVNVNDAPWYSINKTIHHLQIGDSITRIGNWAIYDFTRLRTASISHSLTSIGNSAFRYCSALPSITFPASLTSIGSYAFEECSGLTSITLPASVASIGNNAFAYCIGLTEVVNQRPTPITINANVFSGVTITACSLKVPLASVSLYQGTAVWQNFNIAGGYVVDASVNNPAGGSVIGGGIYPSTAVLTATPEDGYTFRYWSSNGVEISTANPLSLTLANDTTVMAHFAKQIKTSSTWWELIINESDTTLKITGTGAMPDFDGGGNPWFLITYTLRYLEIGDNITHIGNYAFQYCNNLASVTIGNSVTSIGDYAFYQCRELTSVTIPNSVTSIGGNAFSNCSGLTSLTIPTSVTSIGDYAFAACKGLTSVSIPASVTSIGNTAFSACSNLTAIMVDAANPNYSSLDGVFYDKDKTTLIRYPIGKTGTNFAIPNSVTIIGRDAFWDCSSLISVTIPDSVTSIGQSAFNSCTGLTSISIPHSVTSIGIYLFYGCENLTSATIGNSVTSIGSYTFAYCSSLTSVIIGNSVTSIGMDAFVECSSLTSVIIPNSVTSIGMDAFDKCSSLTSLTIGNSVANIGNRAFEKCTGLREVINLQAEPLTINANIFEGVTISACTLKVAISSVSKYEAAAVWKDFIIEEGGYIVSAVVNNIAYGYVSGEGLCQANGTHTLTAIANAGYVFSYWTLSGVTLSTDNTYSFTVTQDIELTAHFKPTLSKLTVSEGTLSPAFHQDTLNYSVNVDNSITSITLTAQVIDPDAIVTGAGTYTLNTGDNTFTIVVTAADKVSTLTYTVKVNRSTVGVEELRIESGELKIYPNPTKGQLTIESPSLRGTKQSNEIIENVEVCDISGRTVETRHAASLQQQTVLDLSHLSSGIYFIKIKTENGEAIRKIVKQ